MRTRLGAKRSKGGSPCEYLQRRMVCISSLFLNELPTQDTRARSPSNAAAYKSFQSPADIAILQVRVLRGKSDAPSSPDFRP
jgi:hypothetical protein